jgi:hypothetical protein
MAEDNRVGFTQLTVSAAITTEKAYLHCVILTVTDSGDYVDVYEGRDASSGRKIFRLKALANRSVSFNFSKPLPCDRGIYVSFSTTDSEATVVWEAAGELRKATKATL